MWGAARDATDDPPTSRLYTGQEKSNTGLYYYNARWYDSDLGRFIQPDSIIPEPYNPLTLDRFAYVKNNPILYDDPTGHCIGPLTPICVAVVVAAIASVWLVGDTPRQELIDNPALAQQDFEGALYATGVVNTAGESLLAVNSFIVANTPDVSIVKSSSPSKSGSYSTITAGNEIQTYYPPNNGFVKKPINVTLEPGTLIDRYGYPQGRYASPLGTAAEMRALPPGTVEKPYSLYQVMEPIEVQAGEITAWFGQIGGGTQYLFPKPILNYLESGVLRKVIAK